MTRKIGRPSKLDAKHVDKLLEAIRAGNYIETAVIYAGIADTTFYRWLDIGEHQKEGKYRDFSIAVKKAEAEAEARQVQIISTAAENTWQAAAWLLERKHSDRWGQKSKQELTGAGGGPVQVEMDAKTKLIGLLSYGATRIEEITDNKQTLGEGSSSSSV